MITVFSFGSNVISNVVLMIAFKEISYVMISASVKITITLIILFCFGMIGTLLILKWKQWRTNLAYYLENLNNGSEKLHRFRIAYGIKGCLAFMCFVLTFALLYDYIVGKMFGAIFLHLAGIYFLLQINERFIQKVFRKNRKQYYQKILMWTDFISEYRINGNILFSIYTVNFWWF